MKIGVIGAGNVGGTLGRLWAARGHQVLFGSRDPGQERMQELARGAGAQAGTVAEAASFGEVVVLATPWHGTQEAIAAAGSGLNGKVLIDATNPLLPNLAGLAVGTTTSAAEEVAGWAPRARVVKAFNTIGAGYFANPTFDGQAASLFICGDETAAKEVVAGLGAALGFDVVDAGPLKNARLTEQLAMLWIDMTYLRQAGPIAFRLLRRPH
jgi:predicted dinucleotide-binding enzyme